MGHNRLEQKQGRETCPATEQKPEEITLAREIRRMMDNLLEGNSSRSFDFSGRDFYVINPTTSVVSLIDDGHIVFGSVKASLLDSKEWPAPKWIPVSALISRKENLCEIKIMGYDYGMAWNRHRGIKFTLDGSYPRINEIVPSDSLEAESEERKKSHGKLLPPEPIPDTSRIDVEIPARDPRLRSRKSRLEYGIFMAKRISEAASGKELLS